MPIEQSPRRLNLPEIYKSLASVEDKWKKINDELERLKIGRKDEFSATVRDNVFLAYIHLDDLLKRNIVPFEASSLPELLEINTIIHYGNNAPLRLQYGTAISATVDSFYGTREQPGRVNPIYDWFQKHKAQGDKPNKLAAEVCMSIIGTPQLFIEGNHRTGNLAGNWISAFYGEGIFVLSALNAVAYFAPASEIKHFDKRSAWRGLKLPKYQKAFRDFWESHISEQFLLPRSKSEND